MQVHNRRCLVTGAARGIGAEICKRLVGEGALVVGMDLDWTALSAMTLPKDRFFPVAGDVSRSEDVRSALNVVVDRLGGLDVLVNNAGIAQAKGDLLKTDEDTFDRLFSVNVRSIFLFTKYGVPLLEQSPAPCIVNMGSATGLRPRPHLTWYSSSKGCVNVMTKALAIELAPRGIRVNGLCPVATETEMLGVLAGGTGEDDLDPLLRTIPLGRLGRPSDVAAAVLFLISDESAFLTGVNIPVDGGRSI